MKSEDEKLQENLSSLKSLMRAHIAECNKLTAALERQNTALYQRIDLLEMLMIENGITVPDWSDADVAKAA